MFDFEKFWKNWMIGFYFMCATPLALMSYWNKKLKDE